MTEEEQGTKNMSAGGGRYVVVEGPIGVGKTTLAKRLAESWGASLLLEQPGENPFLERFYRAPGQYALQTQLYFLFQRVKQLRDLRQRDLFRPLQVADFMLEKDPLFACITLGEDELDLYHQVFRQLSPAVPRPDLVIYLQAPPEVLYRRVRRRAIPAEQRIGMRHLERLADAYARFFIDYRDAPLLMVNAEHLNFVKNDRHYDLLLEQVAAIRSGRHYFNPVV